MEIVCAPSAAVGTPNVRLSVTERVKHWNETITHRAPAEMPQPETTLTTGVDEAAQARLHALIRANTRLMRSPAMGSPQATPRLPMGTPATLKANRVAERGLAMAEALECNGQLSARQVATLKASALEKATETYKRQREALAPRIDVDVTGTVTPRIATPRIAAPDAAAENLATTARLLDYWDMKIEQLQAMAIERGIKRPGESWKVCCGPLGNRANIIAAIRRHEEGSGARTPRAFAMSQPSLAAVAPVRRPLVVLKPAAVVPKFNAEPFVISSSAAAGDVSQALSHRADYLARPLPKPTRAVDSSLKLARAAEAKADASKENAASNAKIGPATPSLAKQPAGAKRGLAARNGIAVSKPDEPTARAAHVESGELEPNYTPIRVDLVRSATDEIFEDESPAHLPTPTTLFGRDTRATARPSKGAFGQTIKEHTTAVADVGASLAFLHADSPPTEVPREAAAKVSPAADASPRDSSTMEVNPNRKGLVAAALSQPKASKTVRSGRRLLNRSKPFWMSRAEKKTYAKAV